MSQNRPFRSRVALACAVVATAATVAAVSPGSAAAADSRRPSVGATGGSASPGTSWGGGEAGLAQTPSSPAADTDVQRRVPAVKPTSAHSRLSANASRTEVEVKFREGSGIRLRGGALSVIPSVSSVGAVAGVSLPRQAASAADLAQVRSALAGAASIRRTFVTDEASLDASTRETATRSQREQADLNLYYRIAVRPGGTVDAVVDALNALPVVEVAYAAPVAAAPPTPDYRARQGYAGASVANGIEALYAQTIAGGNGVNVRVHDIEYSWNRTHEDVAKLATALVPNGTPSDPFADSNHGTAVAGQIAATSNTIGVTGLVPGATLRVTNAYNTQRGYDLANSITTAANGLRAGDVMLLEQQTAGPLGSCLSDQVGCVAVEWVPAYYDAIVSATSRGIIVVEAAGNGQQNLDDLAYGPTFPGGRADSGAIIVGAGGAGGTGCTTSRTKLWFSNYGRRVDLQGWGECVTTTGYGDLYAGTGVNQWYTGSFGGTSSASPIVASAAASLSSVAKSRGTTLSPREVRTRLRLTGQAQVSPGTGRIGPLPNLRAAIGALGTAVDSAGPIIGAIRYTPTVGKQIGTTYPEMVTWSANDATGVAEYRAWLSTDGVWARLPLATPTSRSVAITVGPGHRYQLAVQAVDTAGNWGSARLTTTFSAGIAQETSAQLTFSAGWTRKAWSSASGGFLMSTATAKASASFTAFGSTMGWVAAKGPTKGVATVYLDGVLYKTVNLYAATVSGRVIVASYAWATPGTHTMKIVASGTAGHPVVDVDAVVGAG